MSHTLHHISIIVQNMDRSRYLFHDVLGFDLMWHLPRIKEPILGKILHIPEAELELVYLQGVNNQVAIELVRILSPKRPVSAAIGDENQITTSICVNVDDIHQIYDQLVTKGWQPYTEIMPIRSPDGTQGRIFCFHTDEGVMIEILEMTQTDSGKITTP